MAARPPPALLLTLDGGERESIEAFLARARAKQAELFAAVREAYGIARQENLKLRDFPTLKHVVKFVYDYRPDLKPVEIVPNRKISSVSW